MIASSPQNAGISLTDELAEATNELLKLGGRGNDAAAVSPPLHTPSPLNLSAGGGGGEYGILTLSSFLAVSAASRLIPIHDDDDETTNATHVTDKQRAVSSDRIDEASTSFDADDNLPSSRLNRLVAPVFSTDSAYSTGSAASTRLRSEKEKSRLQENETKTSNSLDNGSSPQAHHTPTFFSESFPESREAMTASRSNDRLIKENSSTFLQQAISEPPRATLSNIGEAPVIVKLHGNRRLEREAQDHTELNQDGNVHYRIESFSKHQQEDGDQSSLVSLAATAVTTSSQASSRARRRLIRSRSAGSTSVVTEDLERGEDAPFARDVQIRGFTIVGEKSRGFVCYDVRIITTRGTTISILRRFSSFCQLRHSLLSERLQHANFIPSLPPRRSGLFQKYGSHHLEKRRKALQKWLAIVMLDQRWATTKALREWVVGSSDET